MTRVTALGGLVLFVGLTLLFSELRWFRRTGLIERLWPYAAARRRLADGGVLAVASFRELIAPLARLAGERLARLFRFGEELGIRLERIHSPVGVTGFRVRQVGWSVAAFGAAVLAGIAADPPVPVAVAAVAVAPVAAFGVLEQLVARKSARWQQRIFSELPVVSEQLGMLMGAGWSLGAALARIAERGNGACARDLSRVQARIQQGLSEGDALREWADLAGVAELDRLVGVLALDRETADLSRLISEEARSIRREAQRRLVESIERRNQQVWVPVTAATLVPGVLLMGVPFVDALTLFAA